MPDGIADPIADPFETATLRAKVLDGWAASAARFREDANAEDDYALGYYRDRVIVELAQNAADAAARAGVPGRLRLTLDDGTLEAANTGAALDAAGVQALATLRASAKREADAAIGAVGRFGVGFAAVVAVSDAPAICSATGGVRWSRSETLSLVRAIPSLTGELAARSEHVPVLRLPFAWDGTVPDGFATSVTLPLRDSAARELIGRLLAQTGPALLLALPALAEVSITTGGVTRVLTASHAGEEAVVTDGDVVSRWRTAVADRLADPGLLADRPAEERGRRSWSVRWAVPLASGDAPAGRLPDDVSAVLHAPTPTDEPLGLPALLLGSFPFGPDRRHVAPGPLTEFLVEQAAEVYARLLPGLGPGSGLLDLVPGPVALGELDGRLRHAIVSRLPDVAFLPSAEGETSIRVRPRDALLVDSVSLPGLAEYLAPTFPGLIAGSARHPAFRVLGVRRLPLADLTDMLAALDRTPSWWRGLYERLAAVSPDELGELGALPVPLADGRLVRGARGVLLPGPGLDQPGRLTALGLRVAHPDAVHPLLARLGAVEATPRSVLGHSATQAAVEASLDEEDPAPIADVVLGLVAAANALPGDYPWLTDLALLDTDGEWCPAGELLLPGGPLSAVVAADAPFGTVDAATLERYGAAALEAAGVLSSFELLTAQDVDLDDPDLDLDGVDDWAAQTRARLSALASPGGRPPGTPREFAVPPIAPEMLAVRDLELVDPGRWPQALQLLAAPPLRAALVEPTRLRSGGGAADVPSYTAWWLRRHLVLGGSRPGDVRAADSDPLLAGLYDEAGPGIAAALADPAVARALGVRTSLAELLAEPGGPDELLDRMADPARPVTRTQLRGLWMALATAVPPDAAPAPPEFVRAVRGDKVTVAPADDVMVLDSPDLWPLVAHQPLLIAPHTLAPELADLLDLPLVSEEIGGAVESSGQRHAVPEVLLAVLPGAPASYYAHEKLVVDGADVPWRYVDGQVHTASSAGLACGLAWAAGQWQLRHLLAALLTDPGGTARLLADADLDPL